MKWFSAIAIVLLVSSLVFPAVVIRPHPIAASFFDDIGNFFSGIIKFFGGGDAQGGAQATAGGQKAIASSCTLQAEASPSDGGRVDGGEDYTCGQTATLKGYPVAGWELSDWKTSDVGCAFTAKSLEKAVLKVSPSSGKTCTVTAVFVKSSEKEEAKKKAPSAKKDDITITDVPAATQTTATAANCPSIVKEVECGDAQKASAPVFTGSDGCPRKCRTTSKCTDSKPIAVYCSENADVKEWTDGGCNYICRSGPPEGLFYIDRIIDRKSAYAGGENMHFILTGSHPDSGPVSQEDGFYVQSYIYDKPRTQTLSGVNGLYLGEGKWAIDIIAPSVAGKYEIETSLYCGIDTSACAKKYGISAQVTNTAEFTVTSTVASSANGGQTSVPYKPDYTVRIVADSGTCEVGLNTPGNFYVYVKNIGTAPGPAYDFEEWYNSYSSSTSPTVGLQPGEEMMVLQVRPICQPGSTTLHVRIDPHDKIEELTGSNNEASATIYAR